MSVEFWSLEHQVLPFGTPVKVEVFCCVSNISSRDETRVGVEVGSDVLIHQLVGETPPHTIEHGFVILPEEIADRWNRDSGRGGSGGTAGGESRRDHSSIPRSPIFAEAEAGIEAAHAVEVAVVFPVDVDGSDAVLLAKIVADPADCKISARSAERTMVRYDEARRTIVVDKETEIPRALLAGEARSETRLDNTAGEAGRR